MQIAIRNLKTDDLERAHFAVEAEAIETLYTHNLSFWSTRNRDDLSEGEKQTIINDQNGASTPQTCGATDKLHKIYAETTRHGEFSLLEIGAANGTVMQRIGEKYPNPNFRYVGFECLPILAEDFREKFPGQTMHLGDVDDFIAKEKSFFPEAPFTLFYASVVFIMIKPDLVRKALEKAAKLTDQILIYDYVERPDVELDPSESLVLHMTNRPVYWFIHAWEDYFSEIGFKIADMKVANPTDAEMRSPGYDPQLRGSGYVHAVRA